MFENAYENESSVFDIDKKLHSSLKKILISRIVFKEAEIPDPGDLLHEKYKSLNPGYKSNQMKLTKDIRNTNNDLPKPQVVLFPEDKIQNKWLDIRRVGPGLANLGNTCFLNSVVQVLTYTPPLVNYILSGYHKTTCKAVGFCMQCELTNHFNRVVRHNASMGAVRPMSLIQKLHCIGKNFRFGRQEDAHEFLRFVVEAIQKSDYAGRPQLDKVSKETTVANAIFGGYFRSQVQCRRCHHESNTYDPIMDINLDIKECSSIVHAFQRTLKADFLNGDNKYFCERCKTKTDAVKRGSIQKEPNVLTLQLKRFDFSKMFGGKISKDIHFPEELNIRPFMSQKAGEPVVYKLYGVLVHSGYSCNSGHYYCYVKAANGTWYEMNDNTVCQVGLKTVLGAQAYLLFYVKKQTNTQQVSKRGHSSSSISSKELEKNLTIMKTKDKQSPFIYGPQRPVVKELPIFLNKNETMMTSSSATTMRSVGVAINRKPEPNAGSVGVAIKRKSEPGVAVKRKPEPKINVHINLNKAKKNLIQPSIIHADEKPDQTKSRCLDARHKLTTSSVEQPAKVNSLQKLSECYRDADSPNSSVPSSPLNASPLPSTLLCPKISKDLQNTPSEDLQNTPLTVSDLHIQPNNNLYQSLSHPTHDNHKENTLSHPTHDNHKENTTTNNDANNKDKIKITTMKYRNKNSLWSPVTKGALHPRVIINKCIVNENETVKHNTTSDHSPGSSWNEEKQEIEGRMFGPMMPPPPLKRHRHDSITSEAGSSSSLLSQSGNWEIHEKDIARFRSDDSYQAERQHVGWSVSCEARQHKDIHQSKKKSKKKKKHKKKHKHDSNTDDEVDVHSNGETTKRNRKRKFQDIHSSSEDEENQSRSTSQISKKKNKKKRRDDEHQHDSYHINKTMKKKKKKKKKEKRREEHQKSCDESNRTSSVHFNSTACSYIVESTHSKHDDDDKSIETKPIKHKSHTSVKKVVDVVTDKVDNTKTVKPATHHKLLMNDGDVYGEKNTSSYLKSTDTSPTTEKSFNVIELSSCNEKKNRQRKDVPVYDWNEQSKKINTWDGAIKSNTVNTLLNAAPKVCSWDGCDNTDMYTLKNKSEGERYQDEWDEEYDAGKTKKVKNKFKQTNDQLRYQASFNSFQTLQSMRNESKDKNASFRDSRKYDYHGDKSRHSHRKDGISSSGRGERPGGKFR